MAFMQLSSETATQDHQNANFRIIQDSAIAALYKQSLGILPNMAGHFNHMESEGFPQNYSH